MLLTGGRIKLDVGVYELRSLHLLCLVDLGINLAFRVAAAILSPFLLLASLVYGLLHETSISNHLHFIMFGRSQSGPGGLSINTNSANAFP